LRREDNNTLQKFLQAWAEWNNLLGYTEARIKKYLDSTRVPRTFRKTSGSEEIDSLCSQ
jgi:hypothetical protein